MNETTSNVIIWCGTVFCIAAVILTLIITKHRETMAEYAQKMAYIENGYVQEQVWGSENLIWVKHDDELD